MNYKLDSHIHFHHKKASGWTRNPKNPGFQKRRGFVFSFSTIIFTNQLTDNG